MATSVKKLGL